MVQRCPVGLDDVGDEVLAFGVSPLDDSVRMRDGQVAAAPRPRSPTILMSAVDRRSNELGVYITLSG
jgi:hypothetical protein